MQIMKTSKLFSIGLGIAVVLSVLTGCQGVQKANVSKLSSSRGAERIYLGLAPRDGTLLKASKKIVLEAVKPDALGQVVNRLEVDELGEQQRVLFSGPLYSSSARDGTVKGIVGSLKVLDGRDRSLAQSITRTADLLEQTDSSEVLRAVIVSQGFTPSEDKEQAQQVQAAVARIRVKSGGRVRVCIAGVLPDRVLPLTPLFNAARDSVSLVPLEQAKRCLQR